MGNALKLHYRRNSSISWKSYLTQDLVDVFEHRKLIYNGDTLIPFHYSACVFKCPFCHRSVHLPSSQPRIADELAESWLRQTRSFRFLNATGPLSRLYATISSIRCVVGQMVLTWYVSNKSAPKPHQNVTTFVLQIGRTTMQCRENQLSMKPWTLFLGFFLRLSPQEASNLLFIYFYKFN